jgi:transcriptional regulator with XRE-family HTH domain
MNARAAQPEAPVPAITAAVGRAIRDLRDQAAMTARDLASRSGVSAAMISRIENGQVSPSLATLEQLAGALQAPLVSFFRETGSAVSDFTLVKQGGGPKSRRLMGAHAHEFTVLGFHRRIDLQFESVLVTVERNEAASPPRYTGHGCVFIYVLEGSATYRYGEETMRLDAGDSLSLDAELRYGIEEVLSPRIRFLSVQAERR